MVSSTVLHDPHSGFLVKDVCIVGVEVSFYKSKNEKQVNQATSLTTSLTSRSQTENLEAEVIRPMLEEVPGQNPGELMDFKGLGQIEKDFVPLLVEVCSLHPSVVESQQKRSCKFREWAFTALGRALYFLKTRKVKDMNDLSCKDLQIFWEELQTFGFDLSWLEHHVQSALGMKSFVEKMKEVEKLKGKVVALELEKERLMAKLVAVNVNLYAARDVLMLTAEDLKEIDLDAGLGFVKP